MIQSKINESIFLTYTSGNSSKNTYVKTIILTATAALDPAFLYTTSYFKKRKKLKSKRGIISKLLMEGILNKKQTWILTLTPFCMLVLGKVILDSIQPHSSPWSCLHKKLIHQKICKEDKKAVICLENSENDHQTQQL